MTTRTVFSPRLILIYAQHLSGVGHYVRTYEIARALAPHHEVHWVEGGRPVPHRLCPSLRVVELPRIRRAPDGGLQGVDLSRPIALLMRERAARLLDAARTIRPEVFLVEYFPFSKWELADELLPVIEQVRAGGGQVLCSLRDVVRKTRFETVAAGAYAERVAELLNRHFDALLVHADPAVTRLEEHFPALDLIRVPIHYTGLVSQQIGCAPHIESEIAQRTGGRPYVLASAGGGAGGRQLIEATIGAWHDPRIARAHLLVVCTGLDWPLGRLQALRRQAGVDRVLLQPFSSNFLHWLDGADLSISQCGYNTAANLLETRTPAVVSPNAGMSDQTFRAERLAALGLVTLLRPDAISPADLATAARTAILRAPMTHAIRLDGAEETRRWIEAEAGAPMGTS